MNLRDLLRPGLAAVDVTVSDWQRGNPRRRKINGWRRAALKRASGCA